MKDKKRLVKKIKNGLKVAVATALIAVSLTSCGFHSSNSTQEYISQEEIVEAADTLDCDTGYLMKQNDNFIRMKHNDGEPIYVCFDDEFSEDLKTKAKESLDYIFGIVGKINDNYHYEIVDKTEFVLKGNKTKIFYTFGELVSVDDGVTHETNAHLESHYTNRDFNSENPVYYYYKLKINKDSLNNEEKLKYSLNHELLHAFGFGDVYNTSRFTETTTKYYGNTYMNNRLNFDIITPNDLACLISLYADDDCNIEQMKYYLQKYELKFYNHYADLCKQQLQTNEDFNYDEFYFETAIITEDLDKNRNGYEYKITIEDDKYVLEIYDYFTKKLIDSCNGDIVNQKGVLILKEVELKAGMRPYDKQDRYEGGYVQDLTFLMKDGKITLYNYNNNDISYGTIHVYEKSLTQ